MNENAEGLSDDKVEELVQKIIKGLHKGINEHWYKFNIRSILKLQAEILRLKNIKKHKNDKIRILVARVRELEQQLEDAHFYA